jgi:hypothetical protein
VREREGGKKNRTEYFTLDCHNGDSEEKKKKKE